MIRKYHNHTLQTNPRHRKLEPQNICSNETFVRQKKQSNQQSLPLQDDCKLERTQSNAYQTETTQNPHKQWEVHKQQINNNITTALERTAA